MTPASPPQSQPQSKMSSHRKTPKLNQDQVISIIEANSKNIPSSYKLDKHVFVVAIRGYYANTYGRYNANDRGVYDDAMFIVCPDSFIPFQANVDPMRTRKGTGYGRRKGMASLDNGVWCYAVGPHRGRPSFRQACKFRVIRDGIIENYPDTGWHGINLHSGKNWSTSSLGCQTVPADRWSMFKNHLYAELEKWKNPKRHHDWTSRPGKFNGGTRSFPYILISELDRRKGIIAARTILG